MTERFLTLNQRPASAGFKELAMNEKIDIEDIRNKIRILDELEKQGWDVIQQRNELYTLAVDWSRQRMKEIDNEYRGL